MAKTKSFKQRIENLKIGGKPLVVEGSLNRQNAHNLAKTLGISIVTRKKFGTVDSFEIFRVE